MPGNPYPQIIDSKIELSDSGLVVHYYVQKGRRDKNYDIKWEKDRDADVLYRRANNRWAATDSTLLANMDME